MPLRIFCCVRTGGALHEQACRRRRRRISFGFVSSSRVQTDSCCYGQKLGDSNEIVGSCGENEEPLDQSAAAMAGFAQAADSLNPAERFFDPLALDRADAIAGMPSGAAIDCRAAISIILRDVRRATALTAARDKVGGVIVLVTSTVLPGLALSSIMSCARPCRWPRSTAHRR